MKSVNGSPLKCLGCVKMTLRVPGKQHIENIYVCRDVEGDEVYLSLSACRGLGIIHEDFPLPLHLIESSDRGQINAIKSKSEGMIEEATEKNGKKRYFVADEVKDMLLSNMKAEKKTKKRAIIQ